MIGPEAISYCPVDLRLLNVGEAFSAGVARETTEAIIDERFKQRNGKINRKPRCIRDKARNRFLAIIKIKWPKLDELRDAKYFQLNGIRRNLSRISTQISGALTTGSTTCRNRMCAPSLGEGRKED